MIAVIRGPYCTGAVTPSGAAPQVVTPQPQRRAINWCSVTRTVIDGTSNTCRRSAPTSAAPAKPAPQPAHGPGSCRTVESGSATCDSVDPGCPDCPPGLRPLLPRNDFGAGLTNGESDDGGPRRVLAVLPQQPSQLRDLDPQHLHHRPKLHVLSGKLLVGRTRIGTHHTIINNSLPRSTNHAEDLISYLHRRRQER
jgi:hypothetical protein